MTNNFTYIICHMNSSESRQRNILTVVEWLRKLYGNDVQIIVAEQGKKKSKIPNIDSHILYNDEGLFHKTKLLNDATLKSKYEKLIFSDNDVIMSKDAIDNMLDALNKYGAVNPYSRIQDLTEKDTNIFVETNTFNFIDPETYRLCIVFAGGTFGIQRSEFLKIGGFDEDIIGWGGEDDVISHKISNLCSNIELNATAYHLNHDRGVTGMPYHEHYDENVNVVTKVRGFTYEQLIDYCISIRKKFEVKFGEIK